jgi:hypothetical protein
MEQTIQTRSCIHDSIHPCTEGEDDGIRTFWKKGTFVGYIVFDMVTNGEEQKVLKDDGTHPSSLVFHPSVYQEESVELAKLVDLPRDVAVTKKRPTWLHDTL